MPASSHRDPARPVQDAAASSAVPQHHGLFLQPQYTIELPPLDEDEDTFSPPPPPPATAATGGTPGPLTVPAARPARPAGRDQRDVCPDRAAST